MECGEAGQSEQRGMHHTEACIQEMSQRSFRDIRASCSVGRYGSDAMEAMKNQQ